MDPDLEGMALLVRIVDHGGISAAGRALGVPKSSLSRRLARLERRLGTQLLRRNTRSLSLTDAGARFVVRCRPIVAEAEAAQRELLSDTGRPSGLLRVTASVGFGQVVLLPLLLDFLDRHPAVRLDLHLGDERVALIRDGFDLAVRMGELDDAELVQRRLATIPRRLVASPIYLARMGTPKSLEELARHEAVLLDPRANQWVFTVEGRDQAVAMRGRVAVRNLLGIREATLRGMGLALLPEFLVGADLASGRLAEVLPAYEPTAVPATAIHSLTRAPSVTVRHLLDHLAAALRGLR
jgi:DNA-binding transcriptional LysR family regulator